MVVSMPMGMLTSSSSAWWQMRVIPMLPMTPSASMMLARWSSKSLAPSQHTAQLMVLSRLLWTVLLQSPFMPALIASEVTNKEFIMMPTALPRLIMPFRLLAGDMTTPKILTTSSCATLGGPIGETKATWRSQWPTPTSASAGCSTACPCSPSSFDIAFKHRR